MGKSETATASIGIKILLSDLVSQINDTNFNLIKQMLENGHIEDDNEFFNDVYEKCLYELEDDDDYVRSASEYKEYLTDKFKKNGSYFRGRFDNRVESTLELGCLFDKYLLVPIKQILSFDRWGYDRYGTNCVSRQIDFDLSVDIEKYKEIKKFKIVFILEQHSG